MPSSVVGMRTSDGRVAAGGLAALKTIETGNERAGPLARQPCTTRRCPAPTHVCATSSEWKPCEVASVRRDAASKTARSQFPRVALAVRTVTKPVIGAR
jgi:hypothetical protein